MKVLIQTVSGDLHAAAVGAVLLKHGVEAHFSIGSDVPSSQVCSVGISNETATASVCRRGDEIHLDRCYDLIWCRRIKGFELPELHPEDVAYADREAEFLGL